MNAWNDNTTNDDSSRSKNTDHDLLRLEELEQDFAQDLTAAQSEMEQIFAQHELDCAAQQEEDDSLFWATEDETLHNLNDSYTIQDEPSSSHPIDEDVVAIPSSLQQQQQQHSVPPRPLVQMDDSLTDHSFPNEIMGSGDFTLPTRPSQQERFAEQFLATGQHIQPASSYDAVLPEWQDETEALPQWRPSHDKNNRLLPFNGTRSSLSSQSQPFRASQSSHNGTTANNNNNRALVAFTGKPADHAHPNGHASSGEDGVTPEQNALLWLPPHHKTLTELRQEEVDQQQRQRRRRYLLGMCCVFGILGAAAALLVVFLVVYPRETEIDNNSKSPPSPPYILPLPDYTIDAMESNPTSPQVRAYDWLRQDPHLAEYSDARKQQRFALATLYYALGGANWSTSLNWLSYDESECHWWFGLSSPALHPCIPLETSSYSNTTAAVVEDRQADSWDTATNTNLSSDNDNSSNNIFDHSGRIRRRYLHGSTFDADNTVYHVALTSNYMAGSIPPEIALLSNLQILRMPDNIIAGTLPVELYSLTGLVDLNLSWNNLNGTIPTQLKQLTKLKSLDLSANQLKGKLPTELPALYNLQSLNLGANQLTGPLWANVRGDWSRNLQSLQLSGNNLAGSIRTEFGYLSNLRRLVLDNNMLEKEMPSELKSLTALEELLLNDNRLSGTLPEDAFLGMKSLKILEMANNEFSGALPDAISRLPSLQKLWLQENNFSGPLPPQWVQFATSDLDDPSPVLQSVIINDNSFTGAVPEDLCKIDQLLFDCSIDELCGCDCACGLVALTANTTANDTMAKPTDMFTDDIDSTIAPSESGIQDEAMVEETAGADGEEDSEAYNDATASPSKSPEPVDHDAAMPHANNTEYTTSPSEADSEEQALSTDEVELTLAPTEEQSQLMDEGAPDNEQISDLAEENSDIDSSDPIIDTEPTQAVTDSPASGNDDSDQTGEDEANASAATRPSSALEGDAADIPRATIMPTEFSSSSTNEDEGSATQYPTTFVSEQRF